MRPNEKLDLLTWSLQKEYDLKHYTQHNAILRVIFSNDFI